MIEREANELNIGSGDSERLTVQSEPVLVLTSPNRGELARIVFPGQTRITPRIKRAVLDLEFALRYRV